MIDSKIDKQLKENFLFTMSAVDKHLLTIKEASVWATNHLGKLKLVA